MRVKPSLAENASDEAYAEAMVACQGYAPACSDAHECIYEGECFRPSGVGFKVARKLIESAIKDRELNDVYARSWLKLALDALDQSQFLARGAFDALKLVAINRRVRAEYGSPKMKDDI